VPKKKGEMDDDEDSLEYSQYDANLDFVNKIDSRLIEIFPEEKYYLDYLFNQDEVRCIVYLVNDKTYPAPKPIGRFVFKNRCRKYIAPYFSYRCSSFSF
jgi:hypothetical protein